MTGGTYRYPSETRRRGSGWALGFMPLATVAIQYGIDYVLVRGLHTPELFTVPLSGIGIAVYVLGTFVVYVGTRDVALTVGYLVVRWIEGFIAALIVGTAITASLGLSTVPVQTASPGVLGGSSSGLSTPGRHVHVRRGLVSGGLPNGPLPALSDAAGNPETPVRTAVNRQRLRLNLQSDLARQVIVEVTGIGSGPPLSAQAITVAGRSVPLPNSTVRLVCLGAPGTRIAFTKTWPSNRLDVHWLTTLSISSGIDRCDGSVTLANDGGSYRLDGWKPGRWMYYAG
jgi:hypothetical protein